MLPYDENPNTRESDGVDDGGSMVWDGGYCLYVLKGGDGNGDDAAGDFWRYSISSSSWEVLEGVPFGPSKNNGKRLGYAGENVYYWHANSTGFWVYAPPWYRKSGYFTSSVFDAGTAAIWQQISWDGSEPLGAQKSYLTALRVWTRSSADNFAWSDWVENPSGDDLPWENRYFQYRVELSTTDSEVTPMLHELIAYYLHWTHRAGTFTSQALELGNVENWGMLSWEATLPENTSISFATRSSPDGLNWSEWEGLESNVIQSPTRGMLYLQVRVTLRGEGTLTPTLRSYSIAYTSKHAAGQIALVATVGAAGIAAAGVAWALLKGPLHVERQKQPSENSAGG